MNRVKSFAAAAIQHRLSLPRKIYMNLSPQTKPFTWVRFTWDLMKTPIVLSPLPEHYQISRATTKDAVALRKVFSSSFTLDPSWSPAIGEVMQKVQSWLDAAFANDNSACFALRHGTRIIGATVLSLDPNIDNHLAPGPCVLMEYRNRGFGTHLLESSFDFLRQAGLSRVSGIARAAAPVAKFLYPKFGGVALPIDIDALVAA